MDQLSPDALTPAPQQSAPIRLAVSAAPQVNLAFQQNGVPVIRDIELINDSERSFAGLRVELQTEPGVVLPRVWQVERLAAGGTFHITDCATELDSQYLRTLQESVQAQLLFRLLDGTGEVLAEQRLTLEVLAYNEWGGYGNSPELLAAFCMPNAPTIERLLRSASDLLREGGHDGVLHPYEVADPRRIWLQVSAVWNALLALNLDYAYPPKSFERTGQKVRTPEAIVDARRATCLDTSLLLAALFEQMGLKPLLILEHGHAYVGVWLRPEGFSHAYTQDLLALRKRVQLRELLVMESTLLCRRASFGMALKTAEQHLAESDALFEGVLDIAHAREQRILPLSFVDMPRPAQPDAAETLSAPALEEVPDDPALLGQVVEWQQDQGLPTGRLGQWQRRLLDLSLRNPLLNMRNTRSNIALEVPQLAKLEDLMAQGQAFTIQAAPGQDLRDARQVARQTGQRLDEAVALAALTRKTLYVQADQQWLDGALVDLYRKARNDLQEGGSNTLFLAIGCLYWQRPGADTRRFRAPLILLPVTITRQSVRSGIKISLADDEPRFNTTLLEMLRQDFALDIQELEGALPEDDSGTDIDAILNRVRREIRDVSGFEVREEAYLGTFSFAKYLMWKDLVDRTDSLKDNAVVRHLIDSPRDPFDAQVDFVEPHTLDAQLPPERQFTPLSADSSQLAAVMAAAAGKNFVMIGPPGTGKSQTIANMIVHNLGLGRTVLFVSEKAAALDVVYRRLREQGLGEFCLELHSNKARKLDVIRQLGVAWDARGEPAEDRWLERTGQLAAVREELNALVDALHHRHEPGLTLRESISLAAGHPRMPVIDFGWPHSAIDDEGGYLYKLDLAERVQVLASEVGELKDHPLQIIDVTEWSMSWQQTLLEAGAALTEATRSLSAKLPGILLLLGLREDAPNLARLECLKSLSGTLLSCAGKDLRFAFAPDLANTLQTLDRALELLHSFEQDWASLSCGYDRQRVLSIDLAQVHRLWQSATQDWWPLRLLRRRQCRKLLQQQAGAQGANPDIAADLTILDRLQQMHTELNGFRRELGDVPGWAGLDSDAGQLQTLRELASNLREEIAALASDADTLVALRSTVHKLVVHGNELLRPERATGVQLSEFVGLMSNLQDALGHFVQQVDPYEPQRARAQLDSLAELEAIDQRIRTAKTPLQTWCAWRHLWYDVEEVKLLAVMQALEEGLISADQFRQAVEVNYARWWSAWMIDRSPLLRRFLSIEHERRIERFAELDQQVRALTAEYVRSLVRSGLAEREDVTRNSEFGIIRRELEKKTRHKALRQLMSEAPNAIAQLTPCLLMSPLSIAQYLPVEQPPFDLVIFDEASQITVWDAIGAIARGRQTVVVGDPRQLPPTAFFSTTQAEVDEELEEEQDLESILDEMLGCNLPVINLSWHYRSRHESLITFSNQRYYDGNLVTFPSPVTTDTAVSMDYLEGCYERGASQTNRAEAEAIVAEIEQRLMDPARNQQSLGVVTFNQKQQMLILDLLDAARQRNPQLDRFFAEDLIEPVFVKNLESVQGDERDVILFSITFGPDQSGRVSMNFGPLNQSGGERRLNVAITRARMELKVFSSLRAEQIDLSRTAAIGVRDLKHFLEFAERGLRALAEAIPGDTGGFASALEAAVAGDLRQRGWTIRPQIGVSQFRIDLGVVDPDAPDYFLAGIECDGDTYRRAATARDRELVRGSVLAGLGWNILRLWSLAYWANPQAVIDRLDTQLRMQHTKRRTDATALSGATD